MLYKIWEAGRHLHQLHVPLNVSRKLRPVRTPQLLWLIGSLSSGQFRVLEPYSRSCRRCRTAATANAEFPVTRPAAVNAKGVLEELTRSRKLHHSRTKFVLLSVCSARYLFSVSYFSRNLLIFVLLWQVRVLIIDRHETTRTFAEHFVPNWSPAFSCIFVDTPLLSYFDFWLRRYFCMLSGIAVVFTVFICIVWMILRCSSSQECRHGPAHAQENNKEKMEDKSWFFFWGWSGAVVDYHVTVRYKSMFELLSWLHVFLPPKSDAVTGLAHASMLHIAF